MLQVAPLFFDRVEQSGNRQMRLLHIQRDHAVIFADRLDAGQTAPGFQRRTVRISTYGKLDNVMSTETLDQVGRRALGNNLAVVYDRQPIAQTLGFVHVVSSEQDRPPVALERANDIPQLAAALRIKSRRGLVQKQNLWIAHQRRRYRQTLALPAGEFADPGIGFLG